MEDGWMMGARGGGWGVGFYGRTEGRKELSSPGTGLQYTLILNANPIRLLSRRLGVEAWADTLRR